MTTEQIIALTIYLILYTSTTTLLKKVADNEGSSRAVSLFVMYGVMAAWSLVFSILLGEFTFYPLLLLVGAAGVMSSFGARLQWRALGISMTKTVLTYPLIWILALVLSLIFLGEASEVSDIWFVFGVVILLSATFLLGRRKSLEKEDKETKVLDKDENQKWLGSVSWMVVLFGIPLFSQNFFSEDVHILQYLPYTYLGSTLGTIIWGWNDIRKSWRNRVDMVKMPLTGTFNVLTGAAFFWNFQLIPGVILLPIQTFGIAFLPILVGQFWLKEGKELNITEKIAIAMGLIGVFLIAVNRE